MTNAVKAPADYIQGFAPLIAGERVRGERPVHGHINPANGSIQSALALSSEADVDRAVSVARAALDSWKSVSAYEKGEILRRWATLIEEHAGELKIITALECGTPVSFETAQFAARWIRYYAGWCDKLPGQASKFEGSDNLTYVLPEPYGVIAAVLTWNGPIGSLAMKVAPALAAGNTVVIKTPELASFGAIRVCELAEQAGVPPGVLNVLPGGPKIGAALVSHKGIDKISFTGGTETARAVMAEAAKSLRPLALELGGKSANIVFEDADLRTVLPGSVLASIVALSGQGCVFPTRLIVHRSRYEEVVAGSSSILSTIKIGDPLDPTVGMGPVIDEKSCNRIMSAIAEAKQSNSGRIVAGGNRCGGALADGYFIEPTIFADVDGQSSLARNEIFGPVLCISSFDTDSEAVSLANSSDYGLGAYLHTRDIGRAHRAAGTLHAGCIFVNTAIPQLSPSMPFGGVKDSGFGREGGPQGIEEFLRTKSVFVSLEN